MNLQEIIEYTTDAKKVLHKEWSDFIKSSLKEVFNLNPDLQRIYFNKEFVGEFGLEIEVDLFFSNDKFYIDKSNNKYSLHNDHCDGDECFHSCEELEWVQTIYFPKHKQLETMSLIKDLCETLLNNNVDIWYYFWGKNYKRDLINE